MFEIYNSYGFNCFRFEGYEVVIREHHKCFCKVDYTNTIYVNDEFMSLDTNVQQFILYHELGHIHYKHMQRSKFMHKLYRVKRRLYDRVGLVLREELQADFYAVKKLGKKKALEAISATLYTKELKTRRLMIKLFAR